MPIALAYSDYNGGGYSDQRAIGVDVNTSLVKQPQLIIEAYSTSPDFIAPGDTMTLTVRNGERRRRQCRACNPFPRR